MPRAVRNFWIQASIPGKATPLEGGPQSAKDGFEASILQRHNGDIVKAASISGEVRGNHLVLIIKDKDDKTVFEYETER